MTDQFKTWWASIKAKGEEYIQDYGWNLSSYEYHSIDMPMEEAFEAGRRTGNQEVITRLKELRTYYWSHEDRAGMEVTQVILQEFLP